MKADTQRTFTLDISADDFANWLEHYFHETLTELPILPPPRTTSYSVRRKNAPGGRVFVGISSPSFPFASGVVAAYAPESLGWVITCRVDRLDDGKTEVNATCYHSLLDDYFSQLLDQVRQYEVPAISKPLIITEGKTDWRHLKAAFLRLKEKGCFESLNVEFLEYEDDTKMGDAELLRICMTYCKTPQTQPIICIFDRDNPPVVRQVSGATKVFKEWGNNVFSFALPVPAHRQDSPDISIEFFYSDEEITYEDTQGRRLFLSTEFDDRTGLHLGGELYCIDSSKIRRAAAVIDDRVFDREGNNVALPKSDFADHILNRVEGFSDFDVSEFVRIFNIISRIARIGNRNVV
jgi:hypothetical protein